MASTKEIKSRIKSIKKTQKITKTMQMVAASRLKKAEGKLKMMRPYCIAVEALLNKVLSDSKPFVSPLFEKREEKKITVIMATSDRGLCGAFNLNMIAEGHRLIKKFPDAEFNIISVGKKGRDFFKKRGYNISQEYSLNSFDPDSPIVKELTDTAVNLFLKGEADSVYFVYSSFISVSKNHPVTVKLLNLEPTTETGNNPSNNDNDIDFIFEPDKSKILEELLPLYIKLKIYRGLIETFTSESGARMFAMKSATDNAKDMITSLTTIMNKARQAAITKEIVEIVTAGEALGR